MKTEPVHVQTQWIHVYRHVSRLETPLLTSSFSYDHDTMDNNTLLVDEMSVLVSWCCAGHYSKVSDGNNTVFAVSRQLW